MVELAQTLNLVEAAAEKHLAQYDRSSPARSRILSAAGASVTDDDVGPSAHMLGASPELPVPGEVLDEHGIVNARQVKPTFGQYGGHIDRLAMRIKKRIARA
ncbi:hypothetical protein KCP75_25660 [Salmonella enterica subsp. enterica]|nr:hypothetical protein KCP75_25660 [Salmonella enterica subsp. enterica]